MGKYVIQLELPKAVQVAPLVFVRVLVPNLLLRQCTGPSTPSECAAYGVWRVS